MAYNVVNDDLPFKLPDNSQPYACRMWVYSGTLEKPVVPALPPCEDCMYFELVKAVVDVGSTIIEFPSRGENAYIKVAQSTPQHVLNILGPPASIYKKHSDDVSVGGKVPDYIYNYFGNGIDVVFDGKHHLVKRVILHTNSPNHSTFNVYCKCNFTVEFTPALRSLNVMSIREINKSLISLIYPETEFHSIQELFSHTPRPIVDDKGSVDGPFGRTLFYAYPGAMFEIMKKGAVASISLFSVKE